MKTYVRLFLVITFILSATLSQATEIPAGAVSGTWTMAGSPYNINGNIKIEVDDQLVIEPGVVVNFTGHYVFEVFGSLQAVGSSIDSIKFTAPDPSIGWQGIRFSNTGTNVLDSTRFTYCIIENGLAESSGGRTGAGGGIYCISSPDIVIRDCLIRNNYSENSGGGIFLEESSNILIINTTIEGNACNYGGGGIGTYNHNFPTLRNVVIRNNRANQFGGGIYTQFDSSPLLANTTIAGNVAGLSGGGLYLRDSIPVFSTDERSSIYDNRAPLGCDLYSTLPATITVDTFTVASPTDFIASPIENFHFNISYPLYAQANADLYVSPAGNDDNDGLSPGSPLRTILHAQRIIICDDQNPHTIFLDAGTYSPSTNGEIFPVYGISNLTLQGDGKTTTILDAEQKGNILTVYDTRDVAVKSLTIENGNSGGVVARDNVALLLNDLIIRNNSAHNGGGIYADGYVNLILEDVDITDNNAFYGAGLYAADNVTLWLDNVTVAQDTSLAYGGGLYLYIGTSITMEGSTISQNYAQFDGGGIWLYYAFITMSDFSITDNTAGRQGGGIFSGNMSDHAPDSEFHNGSINGNVALNGSGGGLYAQSSRKFIMENMLIHHNSSSAYGAGIYAPSSYNIDFKNVTIANNTGAFSGSALYIPNSFTNITIQNSIFWNNTPNEIYGEPDQVTYSDIKGASLQSWFGEGCIDTDPMFVNAPGGNFELAWTSYPTIDASKSPCIDTGDPQFLSIDPDGSRSDMGYQYFPQNVDFHLKDLSAPTLVASDSNIYISYIIENKGLSAGYPDTTVIYISDDPYISEDDSLLSVYIAGYIPAAGETVVNDTLAVASDFQEGMYYLLAAADVFNRVSEDDETNNMDSVIIEIRHSPKISDQPDSLVVCLGDSTGFNVVATGSEPLLYQWRKDGVELADSTFPYLRLGMAALSDTGEYDCIVSNAVGTLISSTADLKVNMPALIASEFADTGLCVHDSIQVMIEAGGTFPLTYDWFLDDQELSGVPDTMITLENASAAESGIYKCVVTNVCAVVADSFRLTVNPLPEPTLGEDTSICAGSGIDLDPGEYELYDWTPVNAGRIYPVTDSGTYTVQVTDANGCVNADTIKIGVNPLPAFTLGPDSAIYNDETILVAPDNEFTLYLWSDASTENSLLVDGSLLTEGTYQYWLDVTDDNGCMASDTVSVTILTRPVSIRWQESPGMNIHPNPATGYVTVTIPNPSGNSYSLYVVGLTGKVYRIVEDIKTSTCVLNIRDLPKGIYLIEIHGPENFRGRMVVQ